ncbi:MAG: glycosyltransferase family 2 protein [Thermoflexia bacterium]|nr:MAG: glycosyltransferase family 2 protein [Thermoflexia bacterium]
MKVSVIIPVWNGREYLPKCLDALLAQDYPDFEVIVVDNASADGSADLVAEKYPQVRLIRNLQNRGFAGGCNTGLQAAQGDVLVLLNQDAIPQPGWLSSIVEALRNPQVGVVGCKLLYPDGETIQHAGGWIEWPLGLAHHFGRGEKDNGQWDEPGEVDYVTGAAMAFWRDVLQKVGLMDEGFWPGYFEDADFCFRAREAGYKVCYVPSAVAFHAETTSVRDETRLSAYYQRGRLRFILKHLPPQRILTEFVPEEEKYQAPAIRGQESASLPAAYLIAMVLAPSILAERWGANQELIDAVVSAFRRLYESARREEIQKLEEEMGPLSGSFKAVKAGPSLTIPSLQEFQFRSQVPVIGPLIAGFRTLWFNVAARWALRDLIRQQEAINRQQEAINRHYESRLRALEDTILYMTIALGDLLRTGR